ncbi:MAG: hypothetical protein M3Y93_01720 [Pseudomonadota bacterium]|nr:hypothetical protein [Pseudomonadota bacterium]
MVIGSAAARLAGAAVTVADIDVLTSEGDAARLLHRWASHRHHDHVPADSHRFRSLFARFNFSPLPVEIMGGLEFSCAERWESVTIRHTMLVDVDGIHVRIPTLDEQIRLLNNFGRPKDMARAMALRSLHQERL